jgi:peptidoglycan/xylan/chitin deacetylase (PgdA/CDA1 family)
MNDAPSPARRLLRAAQRLLPAAPDGRGVTVLAYHLVGAGTGGAVDLDDDVFRRQVEELAAKAEVVPLRSLGEAAAASPAGRPCVALTFDDAYANFFSRAWPLLAERRLPATLFVPVGFVEGTHPAPIRGTGRLPPARWEEIAEAAAGGLLEVGSHSWSHPDLRRLDDAALDRELAGSRRRLEERLGVRVDSFCYPRALWDRRVERRVAAHYARAVVGGGRRWRPPQSPWRIQRVSLRRDGPASLAPVVAAPLWLEEWAADRARRLRPARGGGR